jgi:penicillin-insensitive murein DD-endopeptidase
VSACPSPRSPSAADLAASAPKPVDGADVADAAPPPRHGWEQYTTPSGDMAEAIGSYSAGCVQGAVALPREGKGFQTMRLSRQRFWGHPHLVDFIGNLGKKVADERLGVLLVGDLGQARGGPTPTGHRSHQTGLDVDIWFWMPDRARKRSLSDDERETLSARSYVDGQRTLKKRAWQKTHVRVLELAATSANVDRVFVHPAIKADLCARYPGAPWLARVRPWWGHDDHFHVRLACPIDSPDCQAQSPVGTSDGCGKALSWWFSPRVDAPAAKPPAEPTALPMRCMALREPNLTPENVGTIVSSP